MKLLLIVKWSWLYRMLRVIGVLLICSLFLASCSSGTADEQYNQPMVPERLGGDYIVITAPVMMGDYVCRKDGIFMSFDLINKLRAKVNASENK